MNLKFYQKLQKELQEKQAQLVAVTKYSPVEEINTAIKQGINKIGENRVESLEEKIKNLLPVEKHFIGVIQSQKIRKIINLFDVIQSVSSLKHLQKINRIAEEENKTAKRKIICIIAQRDSKQPLIFLPVLFFQALERLLSPYPFNELTLVHAEIALITLTLEQFLEWASHSAVIEALKEYGENKDRHTQ